MNSRLHLAIGQIQAQKGDYRSNLARLRLVFDELDTVDPRPQLLHLPETALTGYFLEGGVRDLALTAGTLANDLDEVYSAGRERPPIDVVVGFYELWRNTLYNSALYARLGEGEGPSVVHVHRKNFLPTYGMFDEERFVEPGLEIGAFDTTWGRAAMLVCEDAWHSISGCIAALDGAQLLFVCSAAPARGGWPRDDGVVGPASAARWERLIRGIAEENGIFVSLANLVGCEGGKIFGGASLLVGPGGDVRMRAPVWDEAVMTMSLDLPDITRVRADMPLLSDLRVALPHVQASLDRTLYSGEPRTPVYDPAAVESDVVERAASKSGRSSRTAHGIDIVAAGDGAQSAPHSLELDAPLVESWLTGFIREELRQRQFTKVILGLSGGVDSAVSAYLAALAIGAENVIAVRLPYRTSSPESLDHARLVTKALGLEERTLDISTAVDAYLANEPDAGDHRRGNVMARIRMIALFDLSARHKAIPLGTGNKTERLLGYFTWHGDDAPPLNPLGDLFKTQVWAMARHLGVPEAIVGKPASADLVKGQTDEGDLGISYERADVLLNWLLGGYRPEELVARGFPSAEVELVRNRLEGTHWKRQPPTVAMISNTMIGESYLRPVDF